MYDAPPHFILRLKPRASRDRDAIIAATADQEGDVMAAKWIASFDRVFGSLAMNPRRYTVPLDAEGKSALSLSVAPREAPRIV